MTKELGGRPRSPRSGLIAGGLAVAVVAAAVTAGAVIRASGTGCGVARCVPAWALPWPDHRDGSVPQRVLDGAVLAFRHRMGQRSWDGNGPQVLAPPKTVIWYAGQSVARGRLVIAVFEADSQEGRRLVTGYAPAEAVMQGQPGWQRDTPHSSESPWILHDAPAPAPRPGLVVGINAAVPGDPATGPLSGDWVIQLASPQVTAMSWRVPVSWPAAGQEIHAPARQGMAVAHAGNVARTITLTSLTLGQRHLRQDAPVGVPGNADSTIPQLAPPGPLATGRNSTWEQAQGQGGSGTNIGAGRHVITVICYGPSPVTFRLAITGPAPDRTLGRIPCDDQPHSLTRTGRPTDILWDTSQLTAWNLKITGAPTTRP